MKGKGWNSSEEVLNLAKLVCMRKKNTLMCIWILFPAFWNRLFKCAGIVTGWKRWQLRTTKKSSGCSMRVENTVISVHLDNENTFCAVLVCLGQFPQGCWATDKILQVFSQYTKGHHWSSLCCLSYKKTGADCKLQKYTSFTQSDWILLTKQRDT